MSDETRRTDSASELVDIIHRCGGDGGSSWCCAARLASSGWVSSSCCCRPMGSSRGASRPAPSSHSASLSASRWWGSSGISWSARSCAAPPTSRSRCISKSTSRRSRRRSSAPSKPANKSADSPYSAALVRRLVESAVEKCDGPSKAGRRVEREPVRRYGATLAARSPLAAIALFSLRSRVSPSCVVGPARRVARRRGGRAVQHRGHARQRDRAARRRSDDHRASVRVRLRAGRADGAQGAGGGVRTRPPHPRRGQPV